LFGIVRRCFSKNVAFAAFTIPPSRLRRATSLYTREAAASRRLFALIPLPVPSKKRKMQRWIFGKKAEKQTKRLEN
jgi:hypothetical protein